MSKRKTTSSSTSQEPASKRLDDKTTVTIAIGERAAASQPPEALSLISQLCQTLADFGTAGTGYAYSFAGSDVTEAKQPGGQDASKTLSNILLNQDGTFKAFGHHARRLYSETGEGLYFTNYKMLLQNVSSGKFGEPMAKASNGQRVPLIDVITKTLR